MRRLRVGTAERRRLRPRAFRPARRLLPYVRPAPDQRERGDRDGDADERAPPCARGLASEGGIPDQDAGGPDESRPRIADLDLVAVAHGPRPPHDRPVQARAIAGTGFDQGPSASATPLDAAMRPG